MGSIARFSAALALFLALSAVIVGAEEAAPKKSGPPAGRSGLSSYAEREAAARNFDAWWKDHRDYLVRPRPFRYSGRQASPSELLKMLILLGYRGELDEVLHAQATAELKWMGSAAAKILGEIVSGERRFRASDLPPGLRFKDIRRYAAMALGAVGYREELPRLARALADPDPELRACAAVSIGELGGLDYTRLLLDTYRDTRRVGEYKVRSAFLAGMVYLADPRALPELLASLTDRDARVRVSVATALGMLSEEAGPRVIGHYLREYANSPSIRTAGIWALAELGRRMAARPHPGADDYTGDMMVVERTLNTIAIHENVPFVRCHLALALAHLGTPSALSTLRSLLYDVDGCVRRTAAVALAVAGADALSDPVVSNDAELLPAVRAWEECSSLVNEARPEAALAAFSSRIRKFEKEGAPGAAAALTLGLARTFLPGRLAVIEAAASSRKPILRTGAIAALGAVRTRTDVKRAAASLMRFAALPSGADENSLDPSVVALIALGMLGSDKPLNFLKSTLVSPPSKGEKGVTRIGAAMALVLLGGLPYREPLISVLENDPSPAVRSAAAFSLGLIRAEGVLETLVSVIEHSTNVDLRANACFALALLRDKAALPVLYGVITDRRLARSSDGNYLRGCAAFALASLKPGPAYVLMLKRELERSDDENFLAFSALAVGLSGRLDALEAVVPLLRHPSAQVRRAACLGIGFSGREEFLPELFSVLRGSADAPTRVQAAVACGLLGDGAALDALAAMLDPAAEGNSRVRAAAAMGIALLGSASGPVSKRLAAMERDPDPRCRWFGAVARYVLGDMAAADLLVDYIRAGGAEYRRVDAKLLRSWVNSRLPSLFKLRSYLFE
ncbi:MAG: hypothetical protein DRP90_00520 [Planctomycetota bacterium]|nr:MAG: hypothetical protein DRP90_00520 [Planctomycetota bacterium]